MGLVQNKQPIPARLAVNSMGYLRREYRAYIASGEVWGTCEGVEAGARG